MQKQLILLILTLILLTSGCTKNAEQVDKTVFVSILPQKYFVDRITGGDMKVEVMVLPGSSPAFYEPSPRQMSLLGHASSFYSIGVPFEHSWLPKIEQNYRNLKIVDTSTGIVKRSNDEPIEIMNSEEHHEEHDHGMYDPHIWLDPLLAKVICLNIYNSLITLFPEQEAKYKENYDALLSDLNILDKELSTKFNNITKRNLLVFHPSWGYFADRYKLKQIAIEIDNKNPTAKETARIIDFARETKIQYIFINEQVDSSQAEKIAQEIGAKIISIDPLAENYIDNLRKVGNIISESIGEDGK
jgi:zinc transport system substrate-binding protein